VGFYFLLSLVKTYLFDVGSAQFESQLNTLLQVNPYDASEGMETFSGFIQRFLINSKLYLSKHLFNFLGLKRNLATTSIILTILVYIIFFIAFTFSFKKNKYLFFTGLYLLFICGATFFSLQTRWDQDRLLLPFFPLILLFLLTGIYYLGEIKKFRWIHAFMLGFFVIVFFANLSVTSKRVKQNNEYLINGLAGNQFYGMTPDWVNYIKMSQWAAKNVPDDVVIACRKPSVSFIYAQRKFHGIYRIPSENADTLLANLKERNVQYVIMGSLRKYPNQKTEYTINTVQRYLYYIQAKYPKSIILVNRIGMDESAFLFKIDYSNAK
jgi:prepilin signal peptidase PulO-like enzyme (type II secretory pathway)